MTRDVGDTSKGLSFFPLGLTAPQGKIARVELLTTPPNRMLGEDIRKLIELRVPAEAHHVFLPSAIWAWAMEQDGGWSATRALHLRFNTDKCSAEARPRSLKCGLSQHVARACLSFMASLDVLSSAGRSSDDTCT